VKHPDDLDRLGLPSIHDQVRVDEPESILLADKLFAVVAHFWVSGEVVERFVDCVENAVSHVEVIAGDILPDLVELVLGEGCEYE
jgi:hypothetical protein